MLIRKNLYGVLGAMGALALLLGGPGGVSVVWPSWSLGLSSSRFRQHHTPHPAPGYTQLIYIWHSSSLHGIFTYLWYALSVDRVRGGRDYGLVPLYRRCTGITRGGRWRWSGRRF